MGIFGTDWVKKAEELKAEWMKAQQQHNFAPPGMKYQRLKELKEAKQVYEAALGKARQQQAAQRKKDKKKKK